MAASPTGSERPGGAADRRLEQVLGNLLRAGVWTAAAVVLAGAVIELSRHGGAAPRYHVFLGEPSELRHVGGIVRAAGTLDGRGVVQLGLVLLMATPIARVVFSLVGFALEKDRTYVVATLIVLLVLLYGLVGGPV